MKKKILLVTLFFGVLFLVRGNIGAWAAADKMPDSRLAKQETTPAPKPAIDINELKKQLDGQF